MPMQCVSFDSFSRNWFHLEQLQQCRVFVGNALNSPGFSWDAIYFHIFSTMTALPQENFCALESVLFWVYNLSERTQAELVFFFRVLEKRLRIEKREDLLSPSRAKNAFFVWRVAVVFCRDRCKAVKAEPSKSQKPFLVCCLTEDNFCEASLSLYSRRSFVFILIC